MLASFLLYPFNLFNVFSLSQGHEQKEHLGKTRPKRLEREPGGHTWLSTYDTGVQKTLLGEHDFISEWKHTHTHTF